MAADGQVLVDSKINTKGINQGVADIKQQFDTMAQHAKTTAAEINNTVRTINAKSAADGMSDSFDTEGDKIQKILGDTERSAKSKAASIAAIYRKQGMSQQEAMQKAWAQIERRSATGSKNVKEDIEDIGEKSKIVGNQMSGNIGTGIASFAKKIGALIASVFAVREVIQFAKESVEASMQLSNALQGLQSIVEGQGRSFSDAQKFIEEYTSDGLIPATNAITAYKNLAARGYDDSQIRQVMVALKDASAFGRQASYTIGEAVQSATEGLKNENSVLVDNAGVTKNVAKMWEEYAESIGTTSDNLTQQQKIQAEVNGILEESKYQAGDAEKVAGTLSGQLSQLSFNFEQLKVAVGDAIAPIVEAVLPTINAAIAKLTEFANAFAAMIRTLTGTTATAEDLANNFNSAADGASNLAEATEEAGNAAKKSLAPFDEIAKLSGTDSDSASSGSTSAGTVGGSVTVGGEVTDELTPKVEGVFQTIAEKLKELAKKLAVAYAPSFKAWNDAFAEIAPAAKDAASRVGEAFGDLWENDLAPLADYIAWDWAPDIANAFNETIAPIFADVMPVLLEDAAADFEYFCEAASGALDGLKSAMGDLETAFKDMCASFSKNWNKYGGSVLSGFTEFKEGLRDTFDDLYWEIIEPIISSAGDMFDELWTEHLKPLWDNLSEAFLSISDSLLTIWNTVIKPFIDWLVAVLAPIVTTVADIIIEAFGGVVGWISDIVGNILDILSGLLEFIAGVFSGDWEKAWDGIVKAFSGVWDGLVNIVKGVVNAIIWVINSLIDLIWGAISAVVNAIGSATGAIGELIGQDWSFTMPSSETLHIPYLAQGAVLPPNKPFMAVVGDQKHGTNIEAPLATIQEAVAIVMEDMIASNIAGHEATVAVLREILEAVLGIHIGDDVIGQAVVRYNAKMAVIRGGV